MAWTSFGIKKSYLLDLFPELVNYLDVTRNFQSYKIFRIFIYQYHSNAQEYNILLYILGISEMKVSQLK